MNPLATSGRRTSKAMSTARARLRSAAWGLTVLLMTVACRPAPVPSPAPDPALPVRQYFAALAAGDTTTAYQLSRSASQWLKGDGLAHGYQPPTSLHVIGITFAPHGSGNLAYVRVQYQLAGALFESTLEVSKNAADPARWDITGGATGRLDVISARCPHVRIANVEVTTELRGPRISGGTPSAGYFEVPPGVYTIAVAAIPAESAAQVRVAVPAVRRDGTPVTATVSETELARVAEPCQTAS